MGRNNRSNQKDDEYIDSLMGKIENIARILRLISYCILIMWLVYYLTNLIK